MKLLKSNTVALLIVLALSLASCPSPTKSPSHSPAEAMKGFQIWLDGEVSASDHYEPVLNGVWIERNEAPPIFTSIYHFVDYVDTEYYPTITANGDIATATNSDTSIATTTGVLNLAGDALESMTFNITFNQLTTAFGGTIVFAFSDGGTLTMDYDTKTFH